MLLCPFVFVWVITYITISIYGTGLFRTAATPVVDVTTRSPESMETFVDRTNICDRLLRGRLKQEELNASIEHACLRWFARRNEYFRLRETQINRFDPGQLLIAGEGICSYDTTLIVLVHSHHKYFKRRDAIRKTWGGASVTGRWPSTVSKKNLVKYLFQL